MDPFIAYDYNHYNALANDYYKVKNTISGLMKQLNYRWYISHD